MSHPVHAFPGQKELAHSGESVMLRWDQRLHMEERGLSILSAHPPCPFLFLKPTTHQGWFKNTHALPLEFWVSFSFMFVSLRIVSPVSVMSDRTLTINIGFVLDLFEKK